MDTDDQRVREELQRALDRMGSLPRHTPEEMARTSRRLEALSFSFEPGAYGVALTGLDADGVAVELRRIAASDAQTLLRTRVMEAEFGGADLSRWAADARITRMRLLCEKYELLTRLRSDEPEAWDEVNELFFDD